MYKREGERPREPQPRTNLEREGERPHEPNRRQFLKTLAAAGAFTAAPNAWTAPASQKPNIILFLVDDMGWMDSTVYGSQYYDTPNVERLSKLSMRFTEAYAANPLCSPTRASILTGKYPARLNFTTPGGHLPPRPELKLLPETGPPHEKVLLPESRRFLPLEEHTLAEALKDTGYKTAFIGKWHMGHPEKYWPLAQGFDVNIGGGRWPGPPSYHSPYHISTLPDGPDGEYIADRLTDEALNYIEKTQGDPFFLCFWHYSVHAPYQAKEDLVDDYVDRRDPRGQQANPVMAAMIKSMDDSLGRLLDKLDELELTEDTILLFFSDNGGNMYDRVAPGQWTPTNNAPLRSGKGSIYEGGVRVPMMVRWPGVVRPGTVSQEIVSSVDFYPTILEMAGLKPQEEQILDGENLAPILRNGSSLDREAIFCHMPHRVGSVGGMLSYPATSVRKGKWKLIRFYETCPEFPNDFELYDLENDIGETNNLAEKKPDIVRELDALIDTFLKDTHAVYPLPNPNYDPSALATADGWVPSGDAILSLDEGSLLLKSTGGDPFIANHSVPLVAGPVTLQFRMQSDSKAEGFVFWATDRARPFHRSRRTPFGPLHDGRWHEYEVKIEHVGQLNALRIDPGAAPGIIRFDWIRLVGADGALLKEWGFSY